MAGAAIASEFEMGSAPGRSFKIEYSGAVMDQIRMAAVDGYHCVPHGGVETGGILFGTHDQGLVRIQAWRPIACEYAKGPSFVLSDKDEAALAEALHSWRSDPELAGLEPTGWYHSHTRSEIFLSDADLNLFQRFFPQLWQVALVVRPASFASARAGFFFREPDSSIHAQSSYREFSLGAVRAARRTIEASPPVLVEREPPPTWVEPEMPVPVERAAPPKPAERETPPVKAPRSSRWKWYAAILILILMGAPAAFVLWQFPPSRQGFLLSTADTAGQLRIVWDRSATSIRSAVRGSLAIEDRGVQTVVKLTAAELRSGSIIYARQSGDVVARLTVELPGGVTVGEATRFLKPGESSAAQTPQPDARKRGLQREALLDRVVESMHRSSPAAAPPETNASVPVPSNTWNKPLSPLKPLKSQAAAQPKSSPPALDPSAARNKPAKPKPRASRSRNSPRSRKRNPRPRMTHRRPGAHPPKSKAAKTTVGKTAPRAKKAAKVPKQLPSLESNR